MRILPFTSYIPTVSGLIHNYLAKEAIFPFYASLKVTSRCGFKCPFCNVKNSVQHDLSTDDIRLILDNISRSSVLLTSFEGGEPLLRSDIEELLAYAQRCKFYVLFTTSMPNLLSYPIVHLCRYIDFLHISIDEGHGNCSMFDLLPQLSRLPTHVSVQTVVTHETLHRLEEKVETCFKNGVTIVVIAATAMDGAIDCFPDIQKLEQVVDMLRIKYPNTIHTPTGYFKSYYDHHCSSASIIINADGYLWYPCNIQQNRAIDLRKTDLMSWLRTEDARQLRARMSQCERNCGWYQYYSINSYVSFRSIAQSIAPMMQQKRNYAKRG